MFTIQECTVNNFVKQYKNHEVKIDALCFTKQITIVKGENGSGKSTLLKAMADLIRYEGEIHLPYDISYMHEQSTLPNDITLRTFFGALLSLQDKPDGEKLDKLCMLFQLKDKMDEQTGALSKGMKTKVNLIQCLLEEKDLYLLDEPFNGLDQESVNELIGYMKRSEKMFIITSHIFFDTSMIDCDVVYV